jgi:hypothetical protein
MVLNVSNVFLILKDRFGFEYFKVFHLQTHLLAKQSVGCFFVNRYLLMAGQFLLL